jgi:hypothetical protein
MELKELDELENMVISENYDDDSRDMVKRWRLAIAKESSLLSVEQIEGFRIIIEKLYKDITAIDKRLLGEYELSEVDRRVIMSLKSEKELFIKMFSSINQKLSDYEKQIKSYYAQIKENK